jgi:hypothetical protein
MCSNDRGGMGGLIVKIGDFWSQAFKPHWRMSQHVILILLNFKKCGFFPDHEIHICVFI